MYQAEIINTRCVSATIFCPSTALFEYPDNIFVQIITYTRVLKLLETEIENIPARKNIFLHLGRSPKSVNTLS